jgi:hypothetical protein
MFPGAAQIYSAGRFLSMYDLVFYQVLFSSNGAKNRCRHITLCCKPLMILPKVTLMHGQAQNFMNGYSKFKKYNEKKKK